MKEIKFYEAPVLELIETNDDIISTSDGINLPDIDLTEI